MVVRRARLARGWLGPLLLLLSSTGCEVVADFDPDKLNTDRTVGPTPLPSLDGALANIPDASVGDGGPLIGVEDDAQLPTGGDGGPDAQLSRDAGDQDGNMSSAPDASPAEDAGPDSGNDDGGGHDISFADAAVE